METQLRTRPETARQSDLPTGITLLEAYSALANNAVQKKTAIDVPFAGSLSTGDRETDFWHLQLRPPA